MQAFIISAFVIVLSAGFLVDRGWAPQVLVYLPEIFGVIAAIVVIVAGTRRRFRYVRPVYWLIFGAFVVVIVCGAIGNRLEPGPIFAGLRIYLRALPFFFLPAVLNIEVRQLRVQLLILLALSLLQLPIAAEQRWTTWARGAYSGDFTFGTLMNSGHLSLYLISAASVLAGFFLRKRIAPLKFCALLLLLLIPTMLNETKITLVAVPMALVTCFIVGAKPGEKVKNAYLAVIITTGFFAVFIPVYDYFMKPHWGYGIVDFVLMEGRLEGYLDRGAQVGQYGGESGKLGGFKVAVTEVSRDPVSLVFGYGIGNVSDSALGEQFTGEHFRLYETFLESSAILVVFEFGLAGFALLMFLYWKIFKDCVSVAHNDDGIMGALAIGWAGVVITMLLGVFYDNNHENRALSILFWYLSGTIAAYRMRYATGAVSGALNRSVDTHTSPYEDPDTIPES